MQKAVLKAIQDSAADDPLNETETLDEFDEHLMNKSLSLEG